MLRRFKRVAGLNAWSAILPGLVNSDGCLRLYPFLVVHEADNALVTDPISVLICPPNVL